MRIRKDFTIGMTTIHVSIDIREPNLSNGFIYRIGVSTE